MIERAAILSTGDELTTGRIVDSNASWIADKLFEIGVDVACVLTVGDYPERLEWAWRQALEQADVVISTGGIGPTADDLTSETVGRVLGVPLVETCRVRRPHPALVRGHRPADAREQSEAGADARQGAVLVPNALGTAPGYRVAHGERTRRRAARRAARDEADGGGDRAAVAARAARRRRSTWRAPSRPSASPSRGSTSWWRASSIPPRAGCRSAPASPRCRCASWCTASPSVAAARLAAVGDRLRAAIGPYCYGEGAVTMEETVGRAAARARSHRRDGGVVHGRSGRAPADQRSGQLGLRARRRRGVCQRRRSAACSACRRPRSRRTAR